MKNIICTTCGYQGNTKKFMKGNFHTELLLWLLFVVPGALYTVLRLISQYEGCPDCKSNLCIPISSPIAKKLIKEIYK